MKSLLRRGLVPILLVSCLPSALHATHRHGDGDLWAHLPPVDAAASGASGHDVKEWNRTFAQATAAALKETSMVHALRNPIDDAILAEQRVTADRCDEACWLEVARQQCAAVALYGRVAREGDRIVVGVSAKWTVNGAVLAAANEKVATNLGVSPALRRLSAAVVKKANDAVWRRESPGHSLPGGVCPATAVHLVTDPPGGHLVVDGKDLGIGPRDLFLTPGLHAFAGSVESAAATISRVRVRRQGGLQTVALKWSPTDAAGTLVELITEPPGAKVSFEKGDPATSPLQVRLHPGEVTVTAERFGYQTQRKTFTVGSTPELQRIVLTLEPESKLSGMVKIPAGSFRMGSTRGDFEERPAREVVITEPYWLDATEVTVKAFRSVMREPVKAAPAKKHRNRDESDEDDEDESPRQTTVMATIDAQARKDSSCHWRRKSSDNLPMNCVTVVQAADFCARVGGRLPTEAEWERAARAGLDGKKYTWGDEAVPPTLVGNLADASYAKKNKGADIVAGYDDKFADASPVGAFLPNVFGLFDMEGNVEEWVADRFDPSAYESLPRRDPFVADRSSHWDAPIVRGSCFGTSLPDARVAIRFHPGSPNQPGQSADEEVALSGLGFRCAAGGAPGRPGVQGPALLVRSPVTAAFAEVDGNPEGQLPQAIGVSPGKHTVRVWADGYEPTQAEITVLAGAPPQVLDMPLAPRKSTLSVSGVLPGGAAWVGATVRIDGKEVGKTPWEGSVAVGDHNVAVREGIVFLTERRTVQSGAPAHVVFGVQTAGLPKPGTTDGMALIPAGRFRMGSDWGPGEAMPEHEVELTHAYFMDTHEVPTAAYTACVAAKGCTPVAEGCQDPYTAAGCATWSQARKFCTWMGKRLPTEAEWERAARGGLDGRTFPSGDRPDTDIATQGGESTLNAYGLAGMAGGLAEWVEDAYDAKAYAKLPTRDPVNKVGKQRVIRGANYATYFGNAQVYWRGAVEPEVKMASGLGFRCVKAQ